MKDILREYIGGRACEILGLGVSNLPLAKRLLELGACLTVRDKKDISALGDEAQELRRCGVRFITGEDCFDSVGQGLIFRSPGIRPDLSAISASVAGGSELSSEIQLFLKLTDAATYGITGSDGKTTSTTLTGEFLQAEATRSAYGSVFVGGNIGEPLLYRLDRIGSADRVVMELSSFQLMTVERAPMYAAITNISPNHLDWHRGMEEYTAAKKNIIGKDTRRLVTNADNLSTHALALELSKETDRPHIYLFSSSASCFEDIFDFEAREGDRALYIKEGYITLSDGRLEEPLLAIADIRIPGVHNIENFMTAIGLVYGSVEASVFSSVAKKFTGVRHRLELVRTLDGVDYFNSSIDSSPTRTAAALSALAGRDIVIICGGYDKRIPYAPLAESLCRHARALVLTGATAKKIEEALLACPDYNGRPEYVYEPSFEAAVYAARSLSRRGGCVLLSPASASFDAFKNFMVRGDAFCEIVNNFKTEEN